MGLTWSRRVPPCALVISSPSRSRKKLHLRRIMNLPMDLHERLWTCFSVLVPFSAHLFSWRYVLAQKWPRIWPQLSRCAFRYDSVKIVIKTGGIAIGKRQRDVGSVIATGSRYQHNTSIVPLSCNPYPDGGRKPGSV